MIRNKIYIVISTVTLIFVIINQNVQAQQNIAQQAYAIFEQSCLICHGENGSYRESLIIEHTALINDGKVIPEDPAGSVFYQRLIETNPAKRMPQGQPPLAPEAIETIRQWILAGAPDWDAIPKPKPDFITTDAMLETIENHINSLSARDKSFARYFTLTHLYNAGETTEALNAYRRALSKLVNSLSWGRTVVKPQPIDAEQTVFYIDLRDYEWDVRNDAWTQIEQAYPYKMTFDAPTQTHLREKLTTLQQEMNCEVPFVHVDWFIATASLPPLYHDILALPETDRELEASLEVFVAENLQNAPGKRVWRAGFNNSRVSRHNRVLERHTSRYGAYWKSYDFAGSSESQSVFTHPLDFLQDGGEIIFNLPNGLQAYLIVDKEGIRLDAAPISIVSNPAVADPTVRTGLSCIGCHTKGMQTFEDEVRAVVEQADNPPFNKERALDLYVEKTEMDELVAEDMKRFRVALEETGGVFGGIEPVQRLHEAFQGSLSAAHAAAAVGLKTDTFLERISNNVSLQNLLGALVLENGAIKRDAWTTAFHDVITALDSPDSILPPVEQRPERIPGAGVYIPDPNLRAVIEEVLGKTPGDVITTEDIATLTQLNAEGMGVRNITGLEFATNLEELIIRGNPLTDLSPLTKLVTLKFLEFSGESLSDLSPLADLINLERLGFWNTSVSDLSPLAGLTKLRWLGFFSNPMISDLSPLAGLTNLKELRTYSSNKPSHLPLNLLPLKSLTGLVTLSVNGSGVWDISPLAELINIEQLMLQGNRISDISALASLKKLVNLNLHTNQIEDVSPLAGLHNLERLQLERNNISDFSPLDGLREHTEIFWFSNPGFAQGGPKIEGPWLWMLVSGSDLSNFFDGVDLLSQASNGAVTELEIATTGATIGSPVGENVWTPNKIAPNEYQNIAEMLRTTRIWEKRDRDNVIYGSIIIHSPREQKTTMFTGATGEYKVWFNGDFLHEYGYSGVWGTDYQEFVPVTLKQGINVLLFGIYSRNDKNDWNVKSGYFGFAPDADYTVLPPRIIADPNLRAVIAEAFDKEDAVPVTLEEMATLTILRASNRDIKDLTGIEAAVNLEGLWISGNPVSNISPLAALKNLIGLAAWDMAIEDFSPLAELTKLKWLELFNTPISDISPLARLTNLERLSLYGTGTENLSPLAEVTSLIQLQIANNETLSDVSPLAGLINLEWLDLHRCDSLSDISSLAGLTKLEYINLNHTRRVYDYSLSPLSGLTGLRRLRLAENRISDVSSLAGLIGLNRLDLNKNQIVDISPLLGLTGLTELYLHANRISDVSPLAGLINLEWLDLRVNQIVDISALDGLAARTYITWVENPGAPIGGPKIEGPWLWLPIPEKQLNSDTDLLSEVSGGAVTEHQIATTGATTGKAVGNYEWAAHKISPIGTDNGFINNMPEMLRAFGLPEEYEWSTEVIVVYGSVLLDSPREQKTRMFVGSEGRNKVWLNGELVYEQLIRPTEFDYWWDDSDGFNQYFPVTLKPGANVLLVAVGNGNAITGHFGFEEGTEYTLLPPSEVDIPDPNLRSVIAEALGKEDANVPITLEEMATLTILRASNRDIKDLTGIAFAVNLEELWISENPISDLSPLVGLKNLIGLGAWDTPAISDLSPLVKLPKLKWLDFGSFPAPDLSPLADIKSLRRLTFHDGGIEDISQLAEFTGLTILDIAYNSTTDLSPITKLTNLEKFVANTNGISDIRPLAALTNLKHLDIHGNKISDVSPLAKLVNLEMVKLYNNSISDISSLESSPIFPNVFWLENPGSAMSGPRIEGPWTWLKLPVEHFDADWLAEASGGAITEQQVATYSATDGQHVGDNVWKSAKIDEEGINILEILSLTGKEHRWKYPGKPPLIYSTIVLNSPREQKTKILEGSEDVSVKIWLNGDLVHKAVSTRSGARLYDRFSHVTLKEGANVLLVAILNLNERHYRLCSVGFDASTEYTVVPPGVGFSFSATETTNLLAGDTFTLNLNAENISDLAGWQGDIAFDPDALEAIEVTEGDFLKSEGGNTFFQGGTIDNTAGKITSLYSARIAQSGVNGTGTLLSVTFKAKAGGETYVTLENFEFSSITGDIIPAVPPNITITVGEYPAWDVNQDGRVSIVDLVLVAKDLGSNTPANLRTDVNRDGVINIQDLILVAQNFGATADSATAPPLLAIDNKELTPAMVQTWIEQAQLEDDGSITFQQGIENLQKLLESLIPEKTALLANYPNPFNPETWVPYHLSKPAEVTLTIYATNGTVVRTLTLGHQAAGMYQNRVRAAHWNGKNEQGELVSSGIYFYTLTAGDFTATRKMLILK